MTQLKKVAGILVGSLLGTAIIAPTFVGMNLEAQVKQQVEQLNNQLGYSAEVVEYRNVWFDSSAVIELTFDMDAANSVTNADGDVSGLGAISTQVTLTAEHGPILLDDGLSFGWLSLKAAVDGKAISDHIDVVNNQPIYQLHNITSLIGNHSFSDKINAFSFDCSSCSHPLEFTVAEYNGYGSVSGEHIEYEGAGGDMLFNTQQGELAVSGLDMTFTGEVPVTELFKMGIYDSDVKMAIKDIIFTRNTGEVALQMKGLDLKTQTAMNEETGLADMTVAYSLNTYIDGQNDGSDFDLEIQFNQIDSDFFAAYDDYLKNTAKVLESIQLGKTDASELKVLEKAFLDTHVLALLKAEPKMSVTKLNGTFAEGSFNGELNSQFVGVETMPAEINDKQFWVSHAAADAKFVSDKALFQHWASLVVASQIRANPQARDLPPEQIVQIAKEQSGVVVGSLLQQGLITEQDSHYVALVSLKDLQLKINDKPMPLPI